MTDHIHLPSEDLPGCRACGDPTERICATCSKPCCDRHHIGGDCESCLVKAGLVVSSCYFCGDTLLGTATACSVCAKYLALEPATAEEAA